MLSGCVGARRYGDCVTGNGVQRPPHGEGSILSLCEQALIASRSHTSHLIFLDIILGVNPGNQFNHYGRHVEVHTP